MSGPSASTPGNLVVGAGFMAADGTDLGATEGNNVFRIAQTKFVPKVNGVVAPLLGTDYVTQEVAEMEVGLPEVSAADLALLAPGSTSTTTTSGVQGSPTYTASTMAAAALAGQSTALKLASVTALAVGMFLGFAASSPAIQLRKVTRVGTVGAGGTGIDIDRPLSAAVASGAAVTQYTGDGDTQIASGVLTNRRLPTAAYHLWELFLPGLNGLGFKFGVANAMMDQNAEFTGGDASMMAPRVKVQSRLDPANPLVSPWYINKYPADA